MIKSVIQWKTKMVGGVDQTQVIKQAISYRNLAQTVRMKVMKIARS